eukprot:CAMPEP_0202891794 /NCGR_PEP_ID=MMETSP1392-20130828/1763_1 /ASSEMBLY_ACC=CAM_ASM_000868 /TAXON_ID=225041 /ORGANISM="Chlamydomonas chlamydogama, Strain SAG 11-48b" /LENGTH=190 /DNA_ID=CAMNT_0049575649 /DNA_START=41 /DNA_END=613 /DNA_ORIENTATION=+
MRRTIQRALQLSHICRSTTSQQNRCRLVASTRSINGIASLTETEKGKTKFSGYYAGGFYINNVQVPGSVMAYSDLYMMWKPRTMEQVTPASLVFLELIKPVPEVLVLGCGAEPAPPSREVQQYLASMGIKVEVLDSRNATGYFNVLNDEGRVVVGALLAPDPTAPLPEVMPEIKEPMWERAPLASRYGKF